MNLIYNLIKGLSKEEVRNVKLFLNRTNPSKSRKDILLFDLIRKSPSELSDADIAKKLYGSLEKNTLYRLKNRLVTDINKSLVAQHFHLEESNTILHLISLARLFRSKGNIDLCYAYLRKAENKAQRTHNYELLDILYSDYIKISLESALINPIEYIEKRKQNKKHLASLQKIDEILSVLTYKIKVSQNYAAKDEGILSLLDSTIQEYASDDELRKDPVLRFRIYHAISRILLQNEDFISLEAYLKETLLAFEKENLFEKNNHDTKLQIYTYLVNSLVKNQKFDEALTFNKKLYEQMEEFNKLHYDKYLFYYYSSQVNIFTTTDPNKAIDVLCEAEQHPVILKATVNITFVYANLTILYFNIGEFKKARKSLSKLKIQDGYSILAESLRLKISVAELLIRFELDDYDYIELLIKNIRKEYDSLIDEPDFDRDFTMVTIISKLIYSDLGGDKEALRNEMVKIIEDSEFKQAHDLINYSNWLKYKYGNKFAL